MLLTCVCPPSPHSASMSDAEDAGHDTHDAAEEDIHNNNNNNDDEQHNNHSTTAAQRQHANPHDHQHEEGNEDNNSCHTRADEEVRSASAMSGCACMLAAH